MRFRWLVSVVDSGGPAIWLFSCEGGEIFPFLHVLVALLLNAAASFAFDGIETPCDHLIYLEVIFV